MTYEKEYTLKLETLLNEVKKEVIECHLVSDGEFCLVELEAEIEALYRCWRKGKLIDTKKHGINSMVLLAALITKEC